MLDISSASYCRSLLCHHPKRRSGKGMVRMRNVGVNWLDGSHTSGFSVSLGWVYPTKKSWIMRASRKIARWGFVNWSDQTKKPWETIAVFTGCLLLCITLSIRYCIPSDNTARCCNVAPPVIRWFIMVYIKTPWILYSSLRIINHSYQGVICTNLSYLLGGPHCTFLYIHPITTIHCTAGIARRCQLRAARQKKPGNGMGVD